MKRILFFVICLPFFAKAQDGSLMIEGTSPALYLNHTVAPKENFYSIGRLYNISPKEIAPFNKISMEKGLNPGQVLKIPLGASNFSQKVTKAADEALVPLYYVVKEKEGLYRIGINHNKLPVDALKKINNIKTDAVSIGTKLIVGYLKVKKDQSAFATKAAVVKVEDENVATMIPPEKKPTLVKKPVLTEQTPVKNENENKAVITEAEKKDTVMPKKEPIVVKPVTHEPRGAIRAREFDAVVQR